MTRQRNEDQERMKVFGRRAVMLGGIKVLLISALVGRMYYLQVIKSEKFRTLAEDNRINLRLLAPPRGRILDRFGVPVAVNRQNYRVLLVREETEDLNTSLDALTGIVDVDEDLRARVRKEARRKRAFVPITVKENLTWEQVSRIEVNAPEMPGLSISVGQTREYPYGASMSHVLGYVARVTDREMTGDPLLELPGYRIGKNGVEKLHDNELRGGAGSSQVEVNAVGRVIRELSRQDGASGRDVVLTLDAGLQLFAHQRLLAEKSGAAVVMDIHSGEVLALASVPSYDPTPFNVGLSQFQWNQLISDPLSPLSNKAIAGVYAPGSTFKMVVALAAMETGIGSNTRYYCNGAMNIGSYKFHCWKRWGHGAVDLSGAIQQSCDVYFYELAKKIGIDRIAEMARRFGLGDDTGIDLPGERSGTIPTKAWKLANIGETWQLGESLHAAIGQGYVLATPIQLAVMTSRLVNGGKAVVPYLTRGLRDKEGGALRERPEVGDIGVNQNHAAYVMKAMDDVTNSPRGTGYSGRIKQSGWEMGGKTGTSQVRRITAAEREAGVVRNEDLPWRRRDHGLFVGYAPVDKPRYACAVIIEHGGGSKAAVPIARDILTEAQRRDPIGSEPMPLVIQAGLEG